MRSLFNTGAIAPRIDISTLSPYPHCVCPDVLAVWGLTVSDGNPKYVWIIRCGVCCGGSKGIHPSHLIGLDHSTNLSVAVAVRSIVNRRASILIVSPAVESTIVLIALECWWAFGGLLRVEVPNPHPRTLSTARVSVQHTVHSVCRSISAVGYPVHTVWSPLGHVSTAISWVAPGGSQCIAPLVQLHNQHYLQFMIDVVSHTIHSI